MKALIFILCLNCFVLNAQSLKEVRESFHAAVLNIEECKTFHSLLEGYKESNDPTIMAYRATSQAMLAQVVWNPLTKLSQVVKYNKQMTQAVAADPENIEIRFLRLAIEHNLPSFLGMSTHLEEDVNKIMKNMNSTGSMDLDPSYGHYIFWFLENSGLCTSNQVLAMKESLSEKTAF